MATQSASRDENRGIQNIQKRVARLPTRTPVGDRYKGMGWDKAANDAKVMEAANDAQFTQTVAKEELEAEQLRAVQTSVAKKTLSAKLAKQSVASRGMLLGTSLGVAGVAYVFQFTFALFSLISLYIHAKLLETQETTWYGKMLGLVVDFPSKLPFKIIGMACWGIVFAITIIVFINYVFFFQLRGISVLKGGATSLLITATCLALNILPVTNIFPFLLIWVIYMCLLGGRK